mgnify:CR=1 FL=1
MPAAEKRITREDVIDFDKFARERGERRKALIPTKRLRRIEVGPVATFYFENFETMLFQVQEMLHIERGGEEQIKDELHAYNPLIPQGSELVATVMFEIEDARRREEMLKRLTHVEEHLFLKIGDEKVYCKPEEDAISSVSRSRTRRRRCSARRASRSSPASTTRTTPTWQRSRRRVGRNWRRIASKAKGTKAAGFGRYTG